jgi:hypothetical protein
MRLAASSRIIAGALAIAAIAAPAASARFDLEPTTTAHSQPTARGVVVRPNRDQQTVRTIAVGPPILRAPRVSELRAINRAKVQEEAALSYRSPATARYSNAATSAYASIARPVAVTAPTVNPAGDGFHYGDAAIGAGISTAIVLLITAGTLTVRRRSEPQHS